MRRRQSGSSPIRSRSRSPPLGQAINDIVTTAASPPSSAPRTPKHPAELGRPLRLPQSYQEATEINDRFRREDVRGCDDIGMIDQFSSQDEPMTRVGERARNGLFADPVLVPPNGIRTNPIRPEQDMYNAKFYERFPYLQGLDTIEGVAVAGGAAAWAFAATACDAAVPEHAGDVDVFVWREAPDGSMRSEAELWATVGAARDLVQHWFKQQNLALACAASAAGSQPVQWMVTETLFHGLLTLRCYFEDETAAPAQTVQFVLRAYPSLSSILHAFDVPAACIAFDGAHTWLSSAGAYAQAWGVNWLHPPYRSLTYERRLAKYFARGYGIVFPGLATPAVGTVCFPSATLTVTAARGNLLLGDFAPDDAAPLSDYDFLTNLLTHEYDSANDLCSITVYSPLVANFKRMARTHEPLATGAPAIGTPAMGTPANPRWILSGLPVPRPRRTPENTYGWNNDPRELHRTLHEGETSVLDISRPLPGQPWLRGDLALDTAWLASHGRADSLVTRHYIEGFVKEQCTRLFDRSWFNRRVNILFMIDYLGMTPAELTQFFEAVVATRRRIGSGRLLECVETRSYFQPWIDRLLVRAARVVEEAPVRWWVWDGACSQGRFTASRHPAPQTLEEWYAGAPTAAAATASHETILASQCANALLVIQQLRVTVPPPDTCAICCEDIVAGSPNTIRLTCGHLFHWSGGTNDCQGIFRIVSDGRNLCCPCCRQVFNADLNRGPLRPGLAGTVEAYEAAQKAVWERERARLRSDAFVLKGPEEAPAVGTPVTVITGNAIDGFTTGELEFESFVQCEEVD